MPLFASYYEPDCIVVLWKMEEDELFFRRNVCLTEKESEYLSKITNSNRRKEFLTIRYLLRNLMNLPQTIHYSPEGKPTIDSKYLSISHSFEIAGLVVSEYPCALDLEKVHPRILNIAHRAFSQQELCFAQGPEELTVCWCVKETIFKLYGQGDVDFKRDIIIDPIKNYNEDQIRVYFHKEKRYFGNIKLKTIEDYKLTWIVVPPID